MSSLFSICAEFIVQNNIPFNNEEITFPCRNIISQYKNYLSQINNLLSLYNPSQHNQLLSMVCASPLLNLTSPQSQYDYFLNIVMKRFFENIEFNSLSFNSFINIWTHKVPNFYKKDINRNKNTDLVAFLLSKYWNGKLF